MRILQIRQQRKINRCNFEEWIQTIELPPGMMLKDAFLIDEAGRWNWIQVVEKNGFLHHKIIYEITGNHVLIHDPVSKFLMEELIEEFHDEIETQEVVEIDMVTPE